MDVRQAIIRLEMLRQETDRLMRGVRCEYEPGASEYELEQGDTAILYCFVAALLVDNLADDASAVWPLLANRVSPELLQHPEVAAQKDYLSAPLNGTPTEILSRMRILPITGPWHYVGQAVQKSLNAEQILVMRLLEEERLWRRPSSDEEETR